MTVLIYLAIGFAVASIEVIINRNKHEDKYDVVPFPAVVVFWPFVAVFVATTVVTFLCTKWTNFLRGL